MIRPEMKKKFRNQQGVSLLELIVAISLFTALMLSATGIFKMVVDGQRNAVSAQNVQENMRYALEKISKEIRMAKSGNADCLSAAVNKVFNTASSSSELYFKNKDGQCLAYYLENGRLKITVGTGAGAVSGFVTPGKITVNNLRFYAVDDLIGAIPSVQPYVAIMMDVKAVGQAMNEQNMKIQMTVSSRYYE